MSTNIPIKIQFVKSLSTAQPSRIVAVKADGDTDFTLYVTDKNGLPFPLKETSSGIITAIQNTDGKLVITGSDTKTINVAPALLSLINSALQAGDNISELVNDASYITLADIPTFVASDYDLEDFTNISGDPFVRNSEITNGITNLGYTASPTNGVVTSDTGTDATIPLADNTNAGLLDPSKYIVLENTSGTNTGDNATNTQYSGLAASKQDALVSGANIKTIEGQSLLGSGNIDLVKSDVDLSNVDNTSDINKPVSTATQTALDEKASLSLIGSLLEEEIEFLGGESTWVLTNTPSVLFPIMLYAGTSAGGGLILLDKGVDYTLSGNTITYLSPVLPINPNEKHIIHYNIPSTPLGYASPNSDVRLRNTDVYEPINTSAYYKNGAVANRRNLQLMVVTDLHGDVTAAQNAIIMMNEFNTIDGGLNLGDTCASNWLDDFSFINPLMTIGKPFLIAVGNHDEGTGYTIANTGSTPAVYSRFVQPYESSIGGTHAGKSYYYKDWTDYKVRTIMLYEYDDNDDVNLGNPLLYRIAKTTRVWSQAQIDWLITTLNNTPSDYSVMITMHQAVVDQLTWTEGIFTDINHIVPGDSYSVSDEALIPDIVNAWINGTTITGSYPFTGDASYKTPIFINANFTARGLGNFICYMAGHAHVDAIGTVPSFSNQLQVVLTCSTSEPNRNAYGDLQRQQGQRSEDCINIVSFDTFNRKIKIVRIGSRITFDMRTRNYIEIPY